MPYLYSVKSARHRRVTSGDYMSYPVAPCLVRQAIDNRLNRDLIAQAREQGFVFSDPFADADMWRGLETAELEQRAFWCTPDESEWLFCIAMEATLFLIYQNSQRATSQFLQS